MEVIIKDEALRIVGEELNALRERIIANHRNAGQVASGRTIASLKVESTGEGGILWGRQAFGVLESGRGPGKVPKGFYQIIQQWIKDKGIQIRPVPYKRKTSSKWTPKYTPEERGMMALSGAIAYKIAREGTALHRGGGKEDIYSSGIKRTVNDIMNRVFGIFDTEVEHINLNLNENT